MTGPPAAVPCDRHRSFPPRPLAGRGERSDQPRVSPAVSPGRTTNTTGHEGHSFEAVEALLPNVFPPGTDPARIRLPSVPRLRSPEDDEAHHLRYWQVHVWKTLLRYRRAYADPACTARLRAEYPEVDEVAVRLAGRTASGFPLTPIDSVGCHSALRELQAGATALESTVAALAARSDAFLPDPTSVPPVAAVAVAIPPESSAIEAVPAEPMAQELFVTSPTTPWHGFRLSLRDGRGLQHHHARDGGTSAVEPPGTR